MIEPWGTVLVSPARCHSIHYNHWSPIIHSFLPCELTDPTLRELVQKDAVRDSIESVSTNEVGSLWMEYAEQMP